MDVGHHDCSDLFEFLVDMTFVGRILRSSSSTISTLHGALAPANKSVVPRSGAQIVLKTDWESQVLEHEVQVHPCLAPKKPKKSVEERSMEEGMRAMTADGGVSRSSHPIPTGGAFREPPEGGPGADDEDHEGAHVCCPFKIWRCSAHVWGLLFLTRSYITCRQLCERWNLRTTSVCKKHVSGACPTNGF